MALAKILPAICNFYRVLEKDQTKTKKKRKKILIFLIGVS